MSKLSEFEELAVKSERARTLEARCRNEFDAVISRIESRLESSRESAAAEAKKLRRLASDSSRPDALRQLDLDEAESLEAQQFYATKAELAALDTAKRLHEDAVMEIQRLANQYGPAYSAAEKELQETSKRIASMGELQLAKNGLEARSQKAGRIPREAADD